MLGNRPPAYPLMLPRRAFETFVLIPSVLSVLYYTPEPLHSVSCLLYISRGKRMDRLLSAHSFYLLDPMCQQLYCDRTVLPSIHLIAPTQPCQVTSARSSIEYHSLLRIGAGPLSFVICDKALLPGSMLLATCRFFRDLPRVSWWRQLPSIYKLIAVTLAVMFLLG